jgi:phosphocarrier protein
MLMVMMLGLVCGTKITISADGLDAQKAVNTLVNLIDSKFGEE